jgi:hypothetical protein
MKEGRPPLSWNQRFQVILAGMLRAALSKSHVAGKFQSTVIGFELR